MESPQGQVVSAADSRLMLRSRLGVLTLVLLCAVQFLDIVDTSIVNVALPSIQHSLGFSQQNLQWVASGYILTYGGFLLLGGRLGDLLGRRRLLLTGLDRLRPVVAGRWAGQRLGPAGRRPPRSRHRCRAHGPGGPLQLTTTFREGKDRNTALGVWGAISGMAAAAGVFLGGLLSPGPRVAMGLLRQPADLCSVVAGALALLGNDRGARSQATTFDSQGAALVTGGHAAPGVRPGPRAGGGLGHRPRPS